MPLGQPITFSLTVPDPFDFRLSVRKPAGWSWAAPFEVFEPEKSILRTAIHLQSGRLVGLKLRNMQGNEVEVTVHLAVGTGELRAEEERDVVERVKLGLGFDEDLAGFYSLGREDTLVAQLCKDLYGMRIGHQQTVFETALFALTLQMAPMKRSTQMMNCLVEKYGEKIVFDGTTISVWPTAEKLADLEPEELAKACNLGYRAKFAVGLARFMRENGFPDILELARMSATDARSLLTTLPGIGDYSANIISPHHGFPLDIWTARIFHEILFGYTPAEPRKILKEVSAAAEERWGEFKGYVLYYVLNDLPNLQQAYGLTRLT